MVTEATLLAVEIFARASITLAGSEASRPSGVRLPSASAAMMAPKAVRNGRCEGARVQGCRGAASSAQAIQARARKAMRMAPSASTGTKPQPTEAMPNTTSAHPTCVMVKASSAMPTTTVRMLRADTRDRWGGGG